MSPSKTRSSRQRRSSALLLTAIIACLVSDCGRDPVDISFADYVRHQRDNLTTGLISIPESINTHLLGYGWRLREGDLGYAELTQNTGHVRFFAAQGELRRLAFWGALDSPAGAERYRVLVNGRGLGSVEFGTEWQEQGIDLPPNSVRVGANLLVLRCLECPTGERHRGPNLRLRQLRLLPGAAHGRRIRSPDGGAGGRFLMPLPAYLDVVAELPQEARFRGKLSVRGEPAEPVTVALRVLDSTGEHLAGKWHVGAASRPQRLQADLSNWAGRLVRLRLAASASPDAEVDWRRAAVTGRGGPPRGGRLPLAEPRAPQRSGRLGRPDIVFVLLDAARADAFQPFGGPYPTPALESLATDGTSFTEAHAPASWTQPSVSALLTGFYPDSVGSDAWGTTMSLQVPTLAELLSAAGYRTVLWHQHPFYGSQRELLRGFSEVHWARTNLVDPVPPAELLTAADRPTFTFVHLLPPHTPYSPPAPFRGSYSSWYRGEMAVSARLLNQFHSRRDPQDLSAEDRRYVRDRYLENAAYADSLVGRIRDLLLAERRYDDSLIVVLSDHGESFLEHGRFLHTQQLYRESIHVPLIAKWPGATTAYDAVVEQPVSLVDLLPTLVDGLALETDQLFQGRSLLPIALDGRSEDRPIYAVTRGTADGWRPPSPRSALRYGSWKAIYEPLADRLVLFDVSTDPGEQRNLAAAQPLIALLLRQAVLEQTALDLGLSRSSERLEVEPLDPEVEDRLRDLGYLGNE